MPFVGSRKVDHDAGSIHATIDSYLFYFGGGDSGGRTGQGDSGTRGWNGNKPLFWGAPDVKLEARFARKIKVLGYIMGLQILHMSDRSDRA